MKNEEKEMYVGLVYLILGFISVFYSGLVIYYDFSPLAKAFASVLNAVGIVLLMMAMIVLGKKNILIFSLK